MPAMRDKTTIKPMEWVSLDGRTLDFWVTINGKPRRLTFLALVDCASGYVMGWELATSENAAREAARLRKDARDASRKAAEANGYMADAEFATITQQIPTPGIELPEGSKTVAGRFGGSLQIRAKGDGAKGEVEALPKRKSAITDEMRRNAKLSEGRR